MKGNKSKVHKENIKTVRFFCESMGFIRVLDSLGLQNTSDATFSLRRLGLNNVTGRFRFYIFYCCLSDGYLSPSGII